MLGSETARAIIQNYSGCSLAGYTVEVHPDPRVSTTYAIRISRGNDQEFYLLTNYTNNTGVASAAEFLEECEFSSWPPTSGKLRFL